MNKEFNKSHNKGSEEEVRSLICFLPFTSKEGDPCWILLEIYADKLDDFKRASKNEEDIKPYVVSMIDSARGELMPSAEKLAEFQEAYGDRLIKIPSAGNFDEGYKQDVPANDK